MTARTRRLARIAFVMVTALAISSSAMVRPAAAAAPTFTGLRALTIVTVPSIPGVKVVLNGVAFTTGGDGAIRTVVTKDQRNELASDRDAHLTVSTRQIMLPNGARARFHGWYDKGYHFSATDRSGQILAAAFDVDYRTSFTFEDSHGVSVNPRRVTAMQLKDTLGSTIDARSSAPLWLRGRSVVAATGRVTVKDIEYRLTRVTVAGANVAAHGTQRFIPSHGSRVRIALRLFAVEFRVRDAFFGWSKGSAIDLQMPDGAKRSLALRRGSVTAAGLPPGEYSLKAHARGLGTEQTIEISGDQTIDVKIIGPLDIAIAFLGLVLVGWALVLVGRRLRRQRPGPPGGVSSRGQDPPTRAPAPPIPPEPPIGPPVPTWPVRR